MNYSNSERGFTLIELLVAVTMISIVVTFSASAFRNYWMTQSLNAAQEELVVQLRQLQQRATSESDPHVYGVRLIDGASELPLVQYLPDPDSSGAATETCVEFGSIRLDGSVVDLRATTDSPPGFSNTKAAQTFCAATLSASADQFVMFYGSGTATQGAVDINHPVLGQTRRVGVTGLTGRAEAL